MKPVPALSAHHTTPDGMSRSRSQAPLPSAERNANVHERACGNRAVRRRGRAEVRTRQGVLEVKFGGYVTPECVRRATERLRMLHEIRWALFETSEVQGFDPRIREPSQALMDEADRLGIECIVAVAPNKTVRLIGAAVCLGRKSRVEFFATADRAYHRLDVLREGAD